MDTTATQCDTNIIFLEERQGVVHSIFEFGPDTEILLEEKDSFGKQKVYPGVMGTIWEFCLRLKVKRNNNSIEEIIEVPVIIIDSNHGKKVLAGRFIWGKKVRDQYKICAATVVKLIQNKIFSLFEKEIDFVFTDLNNNREHQILRAGAAIALAPFIPGLKTQGDNVKREPSSDPNLLYVGEVKGRIQWGKEENDIASEICGATGANLSAWTADYIEKKINSGIPGKRILFNTVFISVESLIRSLPILLKHNIAPIVICHEAIFNIYDDDIKLPNGEIIFGGTLISIYPDKDKRHKVFIPRATYNYLKDIYPTQIMPDVNGEVGEKIGEKDIDVLVYDANEFKALSMPVWKEPWKSKIIKAFCNSPGASEALRRQTPDIYKEYVKYNLIIPENIEEREQPSRQKRQIVEVF